MNFYLFHKPKLNTIKKLKFMIFQQIQHKEYIYIYINILSKFFLISFLVEWNIKLFIILTF